MIRLLIPLFIVLFTSLAAAAPEVAKAPRTEPIDITSDRMEADDSSRQVRFLGQVVARQGDVTLYAHEMRVYLQAKAQEIDRIEAYGDVRIVQGEKVATAQKGVLHNREGRIVLTGSPKVHQGDDFVSGDEITVFTREEKSVVRGSEGSRVRATFHPKEEGK
jgi:lipopolysaccharide export system protein LptA